MSDQFVRSLGRISGPLLKDNLLRNGVDLAFKNDLDSSPLLYLEVSSGRLGIDTDSPSHTLTNLQTTKTTTLISDEYVSAANLQLDNQGNLSALVGDINIISQQSVIIPIRFTNNTLDIYNNIIKSTSNIEIRPSGAVDIFQPSNLYNSLTVEIDTEFKNNVIFGTTENNTIEIKSNISSNIIPLEDRTFSLGSENKQWAELRSLQINGNLSLTEELEVNGSNIGLPQGNIIYVSQNGEDRNQGPLFGAHSQAPFRTVKYALSNASSGDTVYIFPGTYVEEFPLAVPTGVSIRGTDLRNTIIVPSEDTNRLDAFLLDGETTVSHLTLKDFYYDSITNTGYAFRFLSGGKVSSRSPYVQDISVITRGSVTSTEDPRGYDTFDAGRGAYIDGSEYASDTIEASMLFHSVTFITPGADAVIMTNGVRVEWLNSFIYFAEHGLVALRGTGRLLADGSSLRYGAEIRSIGSANVYGNIAAKADGKDTIMYLINHNFAYVGTGKDSSNDKTLADSNKHILELNAGKIFFQSQSHTGEFRVGNGFYVDFETGITSIDLSNVAVEGLGRINITTNSQTTIIDSTFIDTGNIRFTGNTILSLTGNVNFNSASSNINLLGDVNIPKNLTISDNLLVEGSITGFGDETSDRIVFNAQIKENILPDLTEVRNIGEQLLQWNSIFSTSLLLNNTRLLNNTVETFLDDLDLIIQSNSGIVELNAADIIQNLTVDSNTIMSDVEITGLLDHTENKIQLGDVEQTGNIEVSLNLILTGDIQVSNVVVSDNEITTSTGDLEFSASGDTVIIDKNNVIAGENFVVQGVLNLDEVISQTEIEAVKFYNNEISIENNSIITTSENRNLQLKSTGTVQSASTDIEIINNAEVVGVTSIRNVEITGNIQQTGNSTQTGSITHTGITEISNNLSVTEQARLSDIDIIDTVITTNDNNFDLELVTDNNIVAEADVIIQENLSVLGVSNINELTVNNIFQAVKFTQGDIEIQSNTITTVAVNRDLAIQAESGQVNIEAIEIRDTVIKTNLLDINITTSGKIDIPGSTAIVTPVGITTQKSVFNIGDLRFDSTENAFEGFYQSRISFGGIYSDDKQTAIRAIPFLDDIEFKINGSVVGSINKDRVKFHGFSTNNTLSIYSNIIENLGDIDILTDGSGRTVIEDSVRLDGTLFVNLNSTPLRLRNTGTGYVKFVTTAALAIPAGDSESRFFVESGDTRWNTELGYLEVFNGTEYQPASGAGEIVTADVMQDLSDEWSLILG